MKGLSSYSACEWRVVLSSGQILGRFEEEGSEVRAFGEGCSLRSIRGEEAGFTGSNLQSQLLT